MENIIDFECTSNSKKHSLKFKIATIALVIIFISIPLFEISPETFPLNQGFRSGIAYCGCLGC
jgi:hypothetical protein